MPTSANQEPIGEIASQVPPRSLTWLRRSCAMTHLLLIGVTWPLWWAAGDSPLDFPRVPFSERLLSVPFVWDRVALSIDLLALTGLAFLKWKRPRRVCTVVHGICIISLVLFDQHRFQPWVYHFGILLTLIELAPFQQSRRYLQWLVISLYLYSAISKADYEFLHTVGQQFVGVPLSWLGSDVTQLPSGQRIWLAGLFPLGEGIVAVLLLLPRTRGWGVAFSMLMHLSLILILGAFGLGHQPGVLVWNGFFMIQAPLLFRTEPSHSDIASDSAQRWSASAAKLVITCVLLFPLTQLAGVCDHWPAWELYSPRNSRVELSIAAPARAQIPAKMRPFLQDPGDDLWCRFDLAAWSLRVTQAPLYPEDRFQLGVAIAMAERFNLGRQVRVQVLSESNRWNGNRQRKTLSGETQLRQQATRYRLNAFPRVFEDK